MATAADNNEVTRISFKYEEITKRNQLKSDAFKFQIWIAVCDYLIIAILKNNLNIKPSMNQNLQILSVSLFEKIPINKLFEKDDTIFISNQESLF